MIFVQEERPEDIEAIRIVNEQAFGQPAEAGIVDKLRKSCPGLLSLVALVGDEVVGHILFSPVKIESSARTIEERSSRAGAVPLSSCWGILSTVLASTLSVLQAPAFAASVGECQTRPS